MEASFVHALAPLSRAVMISGTEAKHQKRSLRRSGTAVVVLSIYVCLVVPELSIFQTSLSGVSSSRLLLPASIKSSAFVPSGYVTRSSPYSGDEGHLGSLQQLNGLPILRSSCGDEAARLAWKGGRHAAMQRGDRSRHIQVQRQALPELSLMLASLDPTPAAVSSAFNVITFLPQYLWLLMVFAPNWDVTKRIMEPLWPVLLFALVHLFIVFTVASTNSDNMADFTELIKVFDPRVTPNIFSDFNPQASMMRLMASPGFVSEEWSHVLAWDLFVGRWIYLDGQRRGIFTSHSVLLCNLIGPPGLLSHAATCLFLGKGLPTESVASDKDEPMR